MSKIRFIVDLEFNLDKFKRKFRERNFKKNWTWKDELKDIFEANMEGFAEDLFGEYDIDEIDWNVEVKEK